MRFHFYVKEGPEQPGATRQWSEPDGVEVWEPSLRKILPPGFPWYPFFAFWLFHQLRLFKNRDYRVLFIREDNRVVQRCCLLPPFFRYPFMRSADLNISIWTHPDYRRKGLAARTLSKALHSSRQHFRRIWYITRETNAASIRLAERCEFGFFGTGKRVAICGSMVLGHFVVEAVRDRTSPDSLCPGFFSRKRDRA